MQRLVHGLRSWFKSRWGRPPPPAVSDAQRARDLIAAVDAGGVPLSPARVNAIARSLGLEVSARDPVDSTIERIRAAVLRLPAQALPPQESHAQTPSEGPPPTIGP